MTTIQEPPYADLTGWPLAEAFWADTQEYFSDGKRCTTDQLHQCSYKSNPKTGLDGCAIGRWIPDDHCTSIEGNGVNVLCVLESMPEWLGKLPIRFLKAVQSWHDCHGDPVAPGTSEKCTNYYS